ADEPANDPTGATLSTPSSTSTPGYVAPKDPAKPTAEEMSPQRMVANQHAVAQGQARNFYSINFVWTLVAGFLVMFMQAGFALVETGLCRAKNAAHTMTMNFMVYALGMTGFFICGYALMCGGVNGTQIGGPGGLGGLPTLNQMATVGSSVQGDSGWGLFGKVGFFLT